MNRATLPAGSYPVMLTAFDQSRHLDPEGTSRLTDWYIEAGSVGLFTNSRSSEMEFLSEPERLELASLVISASAGRALVVSTGTFGGEVAADADSILAMASTGVDSVVIITSHLAAPGTPDTEVIRRLEELIARTGDVALGFYECPTPWKRILTDDMVSVAAQSGRFTFLKDTTHDIPTIARRAALAEGTPLRIYNAQTSSIGAGIRAGASGHSGIAANLFPDLVAWLCAHPEETERAERAEAVVTAAEGLIGEAYPTSAKQMVNLVDGLDIAEVSRMSDPARRDSHGIGPLRAIARLAADVRRELGLRAARAAA